MAFLFLRFSGSATDLNQLPEIANNISFRNSSTANPVVRFKLEFVTLSKEYMHPTMGVIEHALAIIRHKEEYYFYDSMGIKKGQFIKIAGPSAPLPLKNCTLEFACYCRI
jgi:hypothetical protein